MVRGNATANQTERCWQALDHVHPYWQTGTQQSLRRIKPARASADDCDMDRRDCALHYGLHGEYANGDRNAPTIACRFAAKWQIATVVAVPPHSVAKLGATCGGGGKRILLCVDHGQGMRAICVDRDPTTLIIRHIDGFVDGMNRTRRDTGAAIDAHVGIDIGALLVRVEAFDGAYRHAIREAAEMAIVSDDVRHIWRDSNSETNNPRTERTDFPNASYVSNGVSVAPLIFNRLGPRT